MFLLIVGLVLFLGVHSISIVNPSLRDNVIAGQGRAVWLGAYSIIALAGLVLIVWGYSMARLDPTVVYVPPFWLRHVSLLLLVFVFPLFVAAYFPGRIRTATKHPMLVAVKLWAVAHLLANGNLADVLLFGSFLVWAVADRISLKRRVSVTPVPSLSPSKWNDLIVVVVGLLIYGFFIAGGHLMLIGVSPIAR